MKKLKQKDPRGGTGRNQGRKPKYDEETTTISFRVPVSYVEKITAMVNKVLDKIKIKK